jgi:hypothetical protein
MALVLADRVRETTTTAGTGTITLLGAVPSCQSFAVVGNGNTTYYTIVAYSGTEYEVGIGTYTSSGTTLSRDTVLSSSNSGSLVNFSAGTKDVFVDYPAGRAVYEDAAGNVDGYPITGGTINNTVIGGTTPAAGTFTTLTAQNETLKGTGQNLILRSQALTTTPWVTNASPTTASYTDPLGGSTATQFTTSAGNSGVYQFFAVSSGITLTFSVYIKYISGDGTVLLGNQANPSTGTLVFNSSAGTITSSGASLTASGVVNSGGGWYRVWGTFVTTGTSVAMVVYANNSSASSFGAWGVQYEIGSTLNTYIPTTTTAVYGTPTLSFSGVASIGLQSDGSLYETSAGTGNVRFYTNNIGQEQARVSHTASAVNYHQLTGSATGSGPIHSVAGSDTNIDLNLTTKGTGSHVLNTGNGIGFKVFDHGSASTGYWGAYGGGSSTQPRFTATSSSNAWVQTGTGSALIFATNAGSGYGTIQALVAHTASAVNYVQITGNITGNRPYFITAGSDTNISFAYSAKGTGAHDFYTDGLGFAQQLKVAHTASAVNYVQVTGAASGGAPQISAQGSDAGIALTFAPKGTGQSGSGAGVILLGSDTLTQLRTSAVSAASGNTFLEVQRANGFVNLKAVTGASNGDMTLTPQGTGSINIGNNYVNYIKLTGGATGFGSSLSSIGSDTNIPLVLQPKGTGALQAQQTDSTATGGNARGANAVDWQTSRSAASQVASTFSVIGGGYANTSSGYASTTSGGENNTNVAYNGFIGAGSGNALGGNAQRSVIVGGVSNTANGFVNFIGGGAINSGTSGSAVTTQSATMNGTTAVTLSGSNANIKVGQLIQGTSINNFPYTYVAAISGTSLTLSQVASGSSTSTLSFYTPHGVVVGGGNNQATGSYSFIGGGGDAGTAANRNSVVSDWGVVVGGFKNTIPATGIANTIGGGYGNTILSNTHGSVIAGGGTYNGSSNPNTISSSAAVISGGINNSNSSFVGFIGGGFNNTASGSDYATIVNGQGNTANSSYSFISGGYGGTTRGVIGYHVFPASNAPVSTTQGTQQAALLVLGNETLNATPVVLRSNSAAAGTTNQLILPNNSAYAFKGTVIANVTGAANGASWSFEGAIMRGANAASTVLMGTPAVNRVAATAGATAWAIALTADTTNGGLAVTVTGAASTTIRWVCSVNTTETTF